MVQKYEKLVSIAAKTGTPVWSFNGPEIEDVTNELTKAPNGIEYQPTPFEKERAQTILRNSEITGFRNIAKCFKNGERMIATRSFVTFKENDTVRYGQIERRVLSPPLSPFTTLMHTPLALIRIFEALVNPETTRKLFFTIKVWGEKKTTTLPGNFAGATIIELKETSEVTVVSFGAVKSWIQVLRFGGEEKNKGVFEKYPMFCGL